MKNRQTAQIVHPCDTRQRTHITPKKNRQKTRAPQNQRTRAPPTRPPQRRTGATAAPHKCRPSAEAAQWRPRTNAAPAPKRRNGGPGQEPPQRRSGATAARKDRRPSAGAAQRRLRKRPRGRRLRGSRPRAAVIGHRRYRRGPRIHARLLSVGPRRPDLPTPTHHAGPRIHARLRLPRLGSPGLLTRNRSPLVRSSAVSAPLWLRRRLLGGQLRAAAPIRVRAKTRATALWGRPPSPRLVDSALTGSASCLRSSSAASMPRPINPSIQIF